MRCLFTLEVCGLIKLLISQLKNYIPFEEKPNDSDLRKFAMAMHDLVSNVKFLTRSCHHLGYAFVIRFAGMAEYT